ncbi:DUF7678 domain-containing protein [Phascolarctobacterium faecium]|uniref:DUF7678 domain-containing protein n=1 Tax=Phascolarctobacterium faecium TaxID=33025 RepID=UPI003079C954
MMWKTGAMLIKGKVYKYQVKVYEVGSEFGIDGGKISKAWISLDGKAVVNYDRGWDIEPVDEDAEIALAILIKEHN